MSIRLSHCNLRARDLDESLAFYRDVIGLEVRADIPLGPGRWLTVGPPSQPEMEIILEPMTFTDDGEAEHLLQSLMERHVIQTLIFEVDDCDVNLRACEDRGRYRRAGTDQQPYGVRDCSFRDPSGNAVRFSQLLSG